MIPPPWTCCGLELPAAYASCPKCHVKRDRHTRKLTEAEKMQAREAQGGFDFPEPDPKSAQRGDQ